MKFSSLSRRSKLVLPLFLIAFVFTLVAHGMPSLGECAVGATLLGVLTRASMLDVARLSGNDTTVGIVEEVADAHPEVAVMPFRTIVGTSYKTSLRVGRPTVGFRKAGQGISPSKCRWEEKTVECFILSGRVEVDLAIAMAFPDGQSSYEASEAAGVAQASFATVGASLYYGQNATFGNADGFPGLLDFIDANMVVDAGGTTDNVASSVYLARLGAKDVSLVGGMGQVPMQLGQFRDETIYVYDAATSENKALPGRVADLLGWVGVQNLSKYNVARIKKLTTDTGKGLTDALVADAISKFPLGKAPTHIFMSRRSRLQLQKSRSVTIFSGGGNKPDGRTENTAPIPTESMGLPIVCTDSLSDIETLAL